MLRSSCLKTRRALCPSCTLPIHNSRKSNGCLKMISPSGPACAASGRKQTRYQHRKQRKRYLMIHFYGNERIPRQIRNTSSHCLSLPQSVVSLFMGSTAYVTAVRVQSNNHTPSLCLSKNSSWGPPLRGTAKLRYAPSTCIV